jgi:hypothetical protein
MSGFARSGHELNCEKVANGQKQTHAAQQNARPPAQKAQPHSQRRSRRSMTTAAKDATLDMPV